MKETTSKAYKNNGLVEKMGELNTAQLILGVKPTVEYSRRSGRLSPLGCHASMTYWTAFPLPVFPSYFCCQPLSELRYAG